MYKRILTIQDISCVGQCSMTVALPILSACGVETCILPSAILSTHTGGFTGFTVHDITPEFAGIIAHWKKEGIKFDAVVTGYLGSAQQVAFVEQIVDELLAEGGKFICDPAMADGGKLYYGFDGEYVKAIAHLCEKADIILPNITEASFLVDIPYEEKTTPEYTEKVIDALNKRFGCTTVLTGIGYTDDQTGVIVADSESTYHYKHPRITKSFHGTGDIYTAAFAGAYMQGKDIRVAAKIAAHYTLRCIENTVDDAEHWYGVKFETAIPYLVELLGK